MPEERDVRGIFTFDDLEHVPRALGSGRVAALSAMLPIARAQADVLAQGLARARQLTREGGEPPPALDDPDLWQRRLARAELVMVDLRDEIERATVPLPTLKGESTMIVGRVTQGGRGVEGAVVHALAGNRTLASSKPSASTGAFELEVPVAAEGVVKVRVRAEHAGFVGHSEPEIEIKAQAGAYVEVALGTKEEPRPATFPVPNLVGMTPAKARATLDDAKLFLGTLTTKVTTENIGLVIAQSPDADTPTKPDRAVMLTFARSGKPEEDLELFCALVEIQPAFEKVGLAPGNLLKALQRLDIRNIEKLREAFADPAALATRLGVRARARIAAFEEALRPMFKAFES